VNGGSKGGNEYDGDGKIASGHGNAEEDEKRSTVL
jgi:hypothetical protein